MGRSADDERVHSIFEVLSRDHRTVANLLAQLEALSDDDPDERDDLFTEVQERLLAHSSAEDEVVYARFARLEQLADAIREARREHVRVEHLLDEIEDLDSEDPEWIIKVVVLKELVARHVDAEEGLIFELARQEIDAAESSRLAAEFEAATRRVTDDDDDDDDDDDLDDLDDLVDDLDVEINDERWAAESPPLGERR